MTETERECECEADPVRLEDTSAIIGTILTAALCLSCLAEKTGLPPARVRGFLGRIRDTVALTQAHGACAECAATTTTYRIG